MNDVVHSHSAIGAAVTDAGHAALHPWCTEVASLLADGVVSASIRDRILGEIGHVLHNDAPQPVTIAQLLSLGAKIELGERLYTATVYVPALGSEVRGEGHTVEEAALDAYTRKRQAEGHPITERISQMLVSAKVPWDVVHNVALILKRIRLRYAVMTQGSAPLRQAVSPSPCPCCAKGRLVPVRFTESIRRHSGTLRVINLEGDYCGGCGETTVSPAAARRNEHRIGIAAEAARKLRLPHRATSSQHISC